MTFIDGAPYNLMPPSLQGLGTDFSAVLGETSLNKKKLLHRYMRQETHEVEQRGPSH